MDSYCLLGVNDISLNLLSDNKLSDKIIAILDSDQNKVGQKFFSNLTVQAFNANTIEINLNNQFIICSIGAFKVIYEKLIRSGVNSERVFGYCNLTCQLESAEYVLAHKKTHLVSAFLPKSGTEWISHVLRKYMWSENRRVRGGQWGLDEGSLELSVIEHNLTHGGLCGSHIHPTKQNLDILKYYQPNLLVHVRDPRQTLISAVHFFNNNPKYLHNNLVLQQYGLPAEYLKYELNEQINCLIPTFFRFSLDWIERWEAIDKQGGISKLLFTRYDEFKDDQNNYFDQIFEFIGLNKRYELVNPISKERNFRKGSLDEWKNILNSEHLSLIEQEAKIKKITSYNLF